MAMHQRSFEGTFYSEDSVTKHLEPTSASPSKQSTDSYHMRELAAAGGGSFDGGLGMPPPQAPSPEFIIEPPRSPSPYTYHASTNGLLPPGAQPQHGVQNLPFEVILRRELAELRAHLRQDLYLALRGLGDGHCRAGAPGGPPNMCMERSEPTSTITGFMEDEYAVALPGVPDDGIDRRAVAPGLLAAPLQQGSLMAKRTSRLHLSASPGPGHENRESLSSDSPHRRQSTASMLSSVSQLVPKRSPVVRAKKMPRPRKMGAITQLIIEASRSATPSEEGRAAAHGHFARSGSSPEDHLEDAMPIEPPPRLPTSPVPPPGPVTVQGSLGSERVSIPDFLPGRIASNQSSIISGSVREESVREQSPTNGARTSVFRLSNLALGSRTPGEERGGTRSPAFQRQDSFSHLTHLKHGVKAPRSFNPPGATELSRMSTFAVKVCEHPCFDAMSAFGILVNAITIGAQADFACRMGTEAIPKGYDVGEQLFCAFFTVELGVRLFAFGFTFFERTGILWGVFDIFVVVTQLVEEITRAAASHGAAKSVGFVVKLIRMLRLVRILRVLRIIRFMDELRALVVSIINCMRSLFWTLLLLLIGIYAVGVYYTQLVADYRIGQHSKDEEDDPVLMNYFGGLSSSMLSLYQAMSGGIEWHRLSEPLIDEISPVQGFVMCLYVAFTVLALTNVVTGVFVEGALKSAKMEEEEYMVQTLHQLFEEADVDRSGRITTEQFRWRFNSPDFHAYLESMNVNPEEAASLFLLLDADNSGTIDYDEFVGGCMRLRGAAKAIDIIMVLHETKMLSLQVQTHIAKAEAHMAFTEAMITHVPLQHRHSDASSNPPTRGGSPHHAALPMR